MEKMETRRGDKDDKTSELEVKSSFDLEHFHPQSSQRIKLGRL